ncbi:hypothetical protein, partial [Streptomyces halstedii]|uniref:hypothetical protein n=1 Tax=Streptomyces halstedii TaxID=1944 RepID=UPI0033B3FEDA
EMEIPTSVTLYSAVVSKDNIDQYLPTGFSWRARASGPKLAVTFGDRRGPSAPKAGLRPSSRWLRRRAMAVSG